MKHTYGGFNVKKKITIIQIAWHIKRSSIKWECTNLSLLSWCIKQPKMWICFTALLLLSALILLLLQAGTGPSIWWELPSCPNQPATCPSISSQQPRQLLFWDLTITQVGQHHSYPSQHQWATISAHEPPLNPLADRQPNVILADVETTTFTNTSAWHPKAFAMFPKPCDQIAAKLQPSRALLHCVCPSRPVC